MRIQELNKAENEDEFYQISHKRWLDHFLYKTVWLTKKVVSGLATEQTKGRHNCIAICIFFSVDLFKKIKISSHLCLENTYVNNKK